jgi:hypothetical protein
VKNGRKTRQIFLVLACSGWYNKQGYGDTLAIIYAKQQKAVFDPCSRTVEKEEHAA